MIFNADKDDRRKKLSNALKENIKKRKEFQKKLKEKNKNERPIG
jgi:F0F1-type ATP synthase assembly protein I